MVDIVALWQCIRPHVTATPVRQLSRIIVAMVAMTGRVTMGGLARWAGQGGSYRTIQRFGATVIPWGTLFWVFFRHSVHCPGDVSLVAGDAGIVTKASTCTPGLDRFFARLYGKPVPGWACFTLSRVSVQARRAFPRRGAPPAPDCQVALRCGAGPPLDRPLGRPGPPAPVWPEGGG